MNYQLRGFRLSLIIHAALLLLIIAMNNLLIQSGKPLIIDFSIENSSLTGEQRKTPALKSDKMKVTQPEQIKPQSVVAAPAPQQIAANSNTAAESQAPVSASKPPAGVQAATNSSSAGQSTAKTEPKASSGQGHGYPVEETKQSYLKEHFAYIRNIVQKKLTYPRIARQMKWEGKVIISFIVCPDGYAKEIMVKESSGIEMLDRNAVAAVHEASPFPRPPVEAMLVMPVSYVLN